MVASTPHSSIRADHILFRTVETKDAALTEMCMGVDYLRHCEAPCVNSFFASGTRPVIPMGEVMYASLAARSRAIPKIMNSSGAEPVLANDFVSPRPARNGVACVDHSFFSIECDGPFTREDEVDLAHIGLCVWTD